MSNAKDTRCAHELLDHIANGYKANAEEVDRIRKFLPERPKDVTLDDLLTRVHDAWIKANPSDWGFDTPAEHHDWLFDLRNDLVRILQEQDTPAAAVAALPAGMRLADHERHGRVVAAPVTDGDGRHMIFCLDNTSTAEAGRRWVRASSLTFIDTERAKYAHPKFLETEADYQKAPEGTIAALDDTGTVWLKKFGAWRNTAGDHGVESACIALDSRRVLRWGWGE